MAAYDPKKSLHGFFWVLQNRYAILQAAKPRIHALFTIWQEKDKLSLDFFRIAEAEGFCMLLTHPPWLDSAWQVRSKNPCNGDEFRGENTFARNKKRNLPPVTKPWT